MGRSERLSAETGTSVKNPSPEDAKATGTVKDRDGALAMKLSFTAKRSIPAVVLAEEALAEFR